MSLYTKERKTSIKLGEESKLERIKKLYGEKKVNIILGLESKWEKYALTRLEEGEDAFRILYKDSTMNYLLRYYLNKFENDWNGKEFTARTLKVSFGKRCGVFVKHIHGMMNIICMKRFPKG